MLEALIAILIFSISLIGLIGIQAGAVGLSVDAKYRADAAYLTNQILSQIWVDRANIDTYAHHPTGNCTAAGGAPTGAASANTKVYNGTNSGSWAYQVAKSLPGAAESMQQIVVTDTSFVASGNSYPRRTVTVVVCWKRPQESSWHSHSTQTQINL